MRDDCVIDPVRPQPYVNVSRKGLKTGGVFEVQGEIAYEIMQGHLDA
jgi:hypothetical protein